MMVKAVQKLPKKHKMFILGFSSLMLGLTLIPAEKATASKDTNADILRVGQRYDLDMKLEKSVNKTSIITTDLQPKLTEITPLINFNHFKVKKGDNLAKIFKRAGFSAKTLHKLINSDKNTKQLIEIHPGDTLSFAKNKKGELSHLKYILNKTDTLFVSLTDDGQYQSDIQSKTIETRTKSSTGQITSNFWNAGIEAGLNDKQIMNFADIFGWDIDFANDIRKNDLFTVIYETLHIEGEYIGTGKILAAEFINQGEQFNAILHTDGNFYTAQGRSMKKAFLRAPVNFKYISSSFNPRRKHPVTGRVKAHRGIDYAARTGTPVVSSGNGKVIKAGFSRFNGNYVFIQHGSKYVTKYLHLHKRKVKRGQKVKQGQLVGTVGATGQVTGAHLHYEFLVNGVHRNPRTVKLPKSQSLPKSELAKFKPIANDYLAKLNRNKELQLSMVNP
ncbi:Opacity-associated protein A LysM-like domain-containing protein [Pseudoalteromonas denitrificans DSM 6059]|uniref:Opacity-associated protein A LysM-like domain-containing protein n=2 Tax=Pseudoalteromonas TaxID=53246 RepID=A0A1I1PMR3_9GAMM|nr:Opacity-associated protein A LysM-like domain-containing protein [Pseudoalteromonas denitrificans DSM 6059]